MNSDVTGDLSSSVRTFLFAGDNLPFVLLGEVSIWRHQFLAVERKWRAGQKMGGCLPIMGSLAEVVYTFSVKTVPSSE